MMIPRAHWQHFVGRPVLVHTTAGAYRGHLHGFSNTHLFLHGHSLAAATAFESSALTTLDQATPALLMEQVYFPGAALAVPLAAVVGITAIGLGAMGAW